MTLAWWREWRPSVVAGGVAFVGFWCITEAVALISLHTGGASTSLLSAADPLNSVWARWDSGWYLLIARSGYVSNEHVQIAPGFYQDASAFAPLYPLLIRAGTHLLPLSDIGVASLITALALLFGLVVVHRLALHDIDHRGANLALLLLLTFPSAFFLHAIYADSLLLLCVAATLLAARGRHWWIASAFAGAAVLTKVYSIVLVVPLAVEYFSARNWSARSVGVDVVAIAAGPLLALGGLAVYMQARLGDALRFLHAQSLWERKPAAPWTAIAQGLGNVTSSSMDVSQRVLAAFDTASLFLLVAGAVYAWVQHQRAYAVFMLFAALLFSSSATLQGSGRYTLTVVPLFIVGAMWLRHHARVAIALALGSAALGGYFLHGYALNTFAG